MLPVLCLLLFGLSTIAPIFALPWRGDTTEVSLPAALTMNIRYGPEYGVQYSQMSQHPKYFDDTVYLGIKGDNTNYRRIERFTCWKTPSWEKNVLLAEEATYSFGKNRRFTNLHGWRAIFTWVTANSYTLSPGEHFVKFTVRACDGKFWGINAVTNTNKGAACGRYWKADEDKNCEVKDLMPDAGYHIIGLYGDANGVPLSRRQGLRGLGLITVKDKP